MKISSLADCPHHVSLVARWHFGEWGHLYPGGTVEDWLDHIRTRINADAIAMTVLALDDDGQPVGTAALGSMSSVMSAPDNTMEGPG